jgi:hypothetical protein
VVAVIDTGIVRDHPDLLHSPIASGYDFVCKRTINQYFI